MKTKALILLLIALVVSSSYAQSSLNGSIQKKIVISGKTSDTTIISPHATKVRLMNVSTKKWTDYIDTDSQGEFSIQNVEKGKYLLEVNDPLVKRRNVVFVDVENNGFNSIQPIVVDRLKKTVVVYKDRKR